MPQTFADVAAAAAALGPLALGRARTRAHGFHGSHARRSAGPGAEFWQYRALEPGEAIDKVDWRRSARSDTLYLRQREREDPVRLWIWVDNSGSMDYASTARLPTKRQRARFLAAALAAAAAEAGERLVDLAESRTTNPQRLFAIPTATSSGTPPSVSLAPGDSVLLVGDFLDDPLLPWVHAAASAGAVGLAIAVADPAESGFPFQGRVHFQATEPAEADRELARAEDLRDRYLAAWAAHQSRLAAVDTIAGWTCLRHSTDEKPADTLAAAAAWLQGK